MTLQELKQRAEASALHVRNLYDRTTGQAQREGRQLTESEKATLDEAMRQAKSDGRRYETATNDQSVLTALDGITGGNATTVTAPRFGPRTLGAQFVASSAFKELQAVLKNRGSLPKEWTSTSSELPGVSLFAATITEGGSGVEGATLVLPDLRPGIVPGNTPPLSVAQLMASANADGNAISYLRETGYTNAADAVAEGGVKPESTITFENVVDPLRKLAHWIPVTEEMLEDVPAMSGYIDVRLRLGVVGKLEDELLNGSGVAPHLSGILPRADLAAPVARAGNDTNADAILKQIAAIETATGARVDGIVLNPVNLTSIMLAKDNSGQYIGASPYDQRADVPTLWQRRIAVTSKIAVGTALVGAFGTAAQVFYKGGVRVESTSSHQDWFIKNLVAIRAEVRAALALYVPAQFGLVTALT